MAATLPIVDQEIKPLQIIPDAQKTDEWYKKNMNYYIHRSRMNYGQQTEGYKDLRIMYEIYNNQFPEEWFSHITNPLSSNNPQYTKFPAKIRPVGILRTNIDLLLGEYPRRPFVYNVENLGDSGYNEFTDQLTQKMRANITQHFVQAALQQVQASGQKLTPEQVQQLQQNPPLPEQVQADFQGTYKDLIAMKGQHWLRRIIREKDVKKRLHWMFKDWLIAGQCYSYKGVFNDELWYEKVSPLQIDYDKSPEEKLVENGEWVVCRRMMVLSDVVERFYDKLSKENQDTLETQYWYNTPMGFYDHLNGIYTDPHERNKVPVFHVQWKGRKKVGFITYFDEETMQMVTKDVDENYPVDKATEQVEWIWVNEVYEGWRIGPDIYAHLRPVPVQRSEMNNHSACKLSYNGRKYSDTHSDNISVLELGIPFQILYIIITYILEKTIAKSKGKIMLIDQNAIPNEDDWDDEKFFYYAEALGYGLLNRNQVGVDKTWNQYQVVDMSLFDQIKQLIELQDYAKQQWDDTIGVTRQRKGETFASDGQGVNERAVFQSTVITDMLFIGFEEFQESELQGLMDYAKFLTSKGEKSLYNDDTVGTAIMEIEPDEFNNAQLGVFIDSSAKHIQDLKDAKAMAQAMLQNNSKPSTVLEVIESVNMSELKIKLKQIESIEEQISQQSAQSEQEHEKAMEEIKQRFQQYQEILDEKLMNAEYDRKEDLEYIRGTFSTYTAKEETGDKDNNGVPDAVDVQKLEIARKAQEAQAADMKTQRQQRNTELGQREVELNHKMEMDRKGHSIETKKLALAHKKLAVDKIKARKSKASV